MARKFFSIVIVLLAIVFWFSSAANQSTMHPTYIQPVKVTYNADVKPIIVSKCAPCHLDEGNEVSYDNYASAKQDIDDIIRSIKLNPGQHGYMPAKNPKLSDSLIHVFEQWKTDSLLEK